MLKLNVLLVLAWTYPVSGAGGLIQLLGPLDEPEFYCVDVPGWGSRLNLDAPLMAHTCKPGADDQLFTSGAPEPGQLYMKAYDLCARAVSSRPGSKILTKTCDASNLQRFSFELDGRIRLSGSDLCLAVADRDGAPTRSPSHMRRDLSLARTSL